MAYKVCSADGLFTGSVWSAVDGTALVSTSIAQTALSTSNQSSAAFNPTAITIDAIYVKVGRRDTGSAATTMTVDLWDSTAGSVVATATVAVNDIPLGFSGTMGNAEDESGWMCLKLSSPVTLANNNHVIRAKLSATTIAVSLRTNGTTANWQHMLRSTAAATTPSAGDDLFIVGEYTTTATWTTRTLTYDDTAATDWGSARANSGADMAPAIYIGQYGAVNCGTTASTNYTLKVSGWIVVAPYGTFTWGSSTTAMPGTCSTYILFDNGASTVYGLAVAPFATCELVGSPRTAGKLITYCVLAADITSASSWTVDTDTGWKSGDTVAVSGRGTAGGQQSFTRVLNADAGASTLTTTSNSPQGPFYGTGEEGARARIILLTRNIRLYATTTGQACCVRTQCYNTRGNATKVNIKWVQFDDGVVHYINAGETLTAPIGPTSHELAYCSFYRTSGAIGFLNIGIMTDAWSIHDCGIFCAINSSVNSWTQPSTHQRYTWSFYNIVGFGTAPNSGGSLAIAMAYTTGTVENLWWAAANGSINPAQTNAGNGCVLRAGTHKNFTVAYTAVGFSMNFGGLVGATLTNWRAYRTSANGFTFSSGYFRDCVFEDFVAKGCAAYGMQIGNGNRFSNVRFVNVDCSSDASAGNWPQQYGIVFTSAISSGIADIVDGMWFDGGTCGTSSSHSTADVWLYGLSGISNIGWYRNVGLRNVTLYSATDITGATDSRQGTETPGAFVPGSNFTVSKLDGAHGQSTTYMWPGNNKRIRNSSIYRTAAPSEELQVVNATASTSPCHSSVRGVCLSSGSTVTASLYMRVSSTYTGAAPLVYLVPNGTLGWYDQAVIGTYSGTAGQADTFVAVSCTTSSTAADDGVAQFYVAAFGTVGSVYLDDWSFTVT